MRDLVFKLGSQIVIIRVEGKNLTFAEARGQYISFAKIDGLKLSPAGIIKEFPDLADKPVEEMKAEAIKRFKDHIAKMNTEQEIQDYLMRDLRKHGYNLIKLRIPGHRDKPMKNVNSD